MSYHKDIHAIVCHGDIGDGTTIWGGAFIGPFGSIGGGCTIGRHVEIGPRVRVGNRCRIQAGAFLPEGVVLGGDVFIGPNATFTNVRYPVGDQKAAKYAQTIVHDRAVIGANATIVAPCEIGEGAFVGAGAVVTKDVPAGETWAGNPARRLR